MLFRVMGLNAAAIDTTITLDAADAADARRAAAAAGIVVLDIRPQDAGAARPLAARASAFALDLFCQELLAMLRAGVTLREALETLARKERGSTTGAVLDSLLGGIDEGRPLSMAMAARPDVFPPLLVESIRAAERTSDYGPALERFVAFRRQGRELQGKLVSATLYPAILLGASAAVLLFLIGYVVPRFAQVYADMSDRLPAASRLLMHAGLAIDAHPRLLAGLLACALAVLVWAWRRGWLMRAATAAARLVPRVRETLVTIQRARLYRTLAMLLSGGLPVLQAMTLARGVLDGDMAARVDAARERIRQGQGFADSFVQAGLSTVVAERFFRVGERTGSLHEMIDRAAEFHEDELTRMVDWVGRVIGPLMMLLMGGLIGVVVVLMYLPIFQLTEALQ